MRKIRRKSGRIAMSDGIAEISGFEGEQTCEEAHDGCDFDLGWMASCRVLSEMIK